MCIAAKQSKAALLDHSKVAFPLEPPDLHSACCFCYRAAATHPKRTSPGPALFPLPTGAHLSRATPDEAAVADWRAPGEAYFL